MYLWDGKSPRADLEAHIADWCSMHRGILEHEAEAALDAALTGLDYRQQKSLLDRFLYKHGYLVSRRAHRWQGDKLLWRAQC